MKTKELNPLKSVNHLRPNKFTFFLQYIILLLLQNNHCICLSYYLGVESPTPKAILTGHQSEVLCVVVSAELGIVVSGSSGKDTSSCIGVVFTRNC